jgi:hypothetical protein
VFGRPFPKPAPMGKQQPERRLRDITTGRVLPFDAWVQLQMHQTGVTEAQAREGLEMFLATRQVFEIVD